MFSFRKWVRGIAAEVATEAASAKMAEMAVENSSVPVNIDSELDDGIILLYAREKRLLPAKEWREKAAKWQEEFETEGGYSFLRGYPLLRHPSLAPVAVAIRRAILEANVEIAEAEKQTADAALKAAKKAASRA